jgi:nitrogen fixation NifU-like protein
MNDLYRTVVLERYRSPRHRHPLAGANAEAHTHNPLCGDEITIQARIEDGRLTEAAFDAHGCSISQASADLMIDLTTGRSIPEVDALHQAFAAMLEPDNPGPAPKELGDAALLQEVRRYPVRVRCALLAWETLHAALHPATDAA